MHLDTSLLSRRALLTPPPQDVCDPMKRDDINPLNAELNPTCHLLALLGAHHILHVSRVRVKLKHFYC